MSKFLCPTQIRAESASVLFVKVSDELLNGFDLYTMPFVAFTGEIVQYMVPATANPYEYRLIEAETLNDFDDKIQNLTALGFDFFMGPVMWNGSYLQWMCRMKEINHELSAITHQIVAGGL